MHRQPRIIWVENTNQEGVCVRSIRRLCMYVFYPMGVCVFLSGWRHATDFSRLFVHDCFEWLSSQSLPRLRGRNRRETTKIETQEMR